MTNKEFEARATENIKQIINFISNDEYSKLHTITNIDNSWCEEGKSQIEAIEFFESKIKELLEGWSEYEEKEFVIDEFDEKNFDLGMQDFDGKGVFSTYNPTSYGETLDFWFEVEFVVDENDNFTSWFNINI